MRDKNPSALRENPYEIFSLVNTEPKNIMLAFCLDEKPRTALEIRDEFAAYAEGSWIPGETTFFNCPHYTFAPLGIVDARNSEICWREKSGMCQTEEEGYKRCSGGELGLYIKHLLTEGVVGKEKQGNTARYYLIGADLSSL